jgi:hypothetical protein
VALWQWLAVVVGVTAGFCLCLWANHALHKSEAQGEDDRLRDAGL